MLPVIEPDGKATARQIVGYTIALLPVSLLPTFLHFSGWIYLAGAAVLARGFYMPASRRKTTDVRTVASGCSESQ